MRPRDVHWSCDELLGTMGLGGLARLRIWESRPTRPIPGANGNGLTYKLKRPSSAWGFLEEDQAPRLTQDPREEGISWHIQEAAVSTPSHPLTSWAQVLLLSLEGTG